MRIVQLDVGDIDRPDLIGKLDLPIAKKIRDDGLLEVAFGQVLFRVDGIESHLLHESPNQLPSYIIALLAEQNYQLP